MNKNTNIKKKFKLGFLGQGKIAAKTLEKIFNNKNLEIVFCAPRLKNKNSSRWFDQGILAKKTKEKGIKLIKISDLNSQRFIKYSKKAKIHLFVNLGHGQLFKKDLINSSKIGVLNYHPGFLPYGRGPGAIVGEIMNSAKFVGRTCHLVNDKFDSGQIIKQEKFKVSKYATNTDLSNLLNQDVDKFILSAIIKIINNDHKSKVMKKINFGRYFPKRIAGDEIINWNDKSINIFNKVRSRLYERYSIIYIKDTLKKYFVADVKLENNVKNYTFVNGQVIDKTQTGVLVKTADTALWITKIINNTTKKKEVPKFKIGTCFQTLNISDFIDLLQVIKRK